MKIRTKLKIISLSILILCFSILGLFYFSSRQENLFQHIHLESEKTFKDIKELNILIYSYIIQPDKETFRKIESNLFFLNKSLQNLFNLYPNKKDVSQNITPEIKHIGNLLTQMKKILEEKKDSPQQELASQKSITDISQDILIRTKDLMTLIFMLDQETQKEFFMTHDQLKLIITVFVFVLIALTLIIIYTFNKQIATPLEKLKTCIVNFAKGNFDKDIKLTQKDEITDLFTDFHQMAADLELAQKKISSSDRRYHLAEKVANIATWEFRLEENRITWSDNANQILQTENLPLPDNKESLLEIVHPDYRDQLALIFKAVLMGKITEFSLAHKIILPDRSTRWIESSGGLVHDPSRPLTIMGIIRYISKQKETEEDVEKHKYYLMKAQEMGKVGSWEFDLIDNKIIWTNETYRIFDLPLGTDLTYEKFLECLPPDDRELVDRQWMTAIQNQQPYDIEHRILANNKIKWVREKGECEYDAQGECVRVIGFTQDITLQKETSQKLAQSEKRLRQIIENSTNLFYSHTPDNRLTYVSPQCKEIFDCTPQEALTEWTRFLSDNPQNEAGKEMTAQAIKTGKPPKPYELELLTRKGRKIWVEVHEAPVVENGQVTAVVGSLTDITEEKKAKEELLRNYTLLNAIIEGSRLDAIYLKDIEGKYLIINSFGAKVFGQPKEMIIGKKDADFLPSHLTETIKKHDHWVIQNNKPLICEETLCLEGKELIFLSSKMPYADEKNQIKGLIGISRDISARKKAENQIKESETRFKELFNNMKNGVAVYEPLADGTDFIFKNLNKGAEEIEKVKREDIIGKKVTEAFPAIKDFGLLEVLKRVNKTGKPESFPVSFYKDNRISGWRDNFIYKLPSGEIVAVYNDQTKEKQAQEELDQYRKHLETLVAQRTQEIFEANEFNQKIISTIPSGLVVLSEDLIILGTNNQFYDIWGIRRNKKIIGKSLDKAIENKLIDDKQTKSSLTIRLKAFAESDLPYTVFEDTVIQKRKTEQPKICKFYLSVIPDEKATKTEKQILLAVEDITMAKSLEQQLIQSERLAATGRLAASVAHEINNPLQGMSTHLDLMKDALAQDSAKLKNYEHVKSNIKRIGEIVGQLLNIYRLSSKEKTQIDINDLIGQVINFVDYQMRLQRIQLSLKLAKDCPKVPGWKQQLHQVFLNLILNAMESIEGAGKISISTICEGKDITIKIKDTGKGISKEDAKHIFAPFFSTKKESGVGLGLFVCKGLIKNHNGTIVLDTKQGRGSTFTIKLKGE